jgi:alpha/beta superfamily hydrolase
VADLEDLLLVSYPFSRYDAAPVRAFRGRLYVVGGSQDDISPLDQLMPVYETAKGEKYLKVLPTSHFYSGVEDELRDFVRQVFGPASSKG